MDHTYPSLEKRIVTRIDTSLLAEVLTRRVRSSVQIATTSEWRIGGLHKTSRRVARMGEQGTEER